MRAGRKSLPGGLLVQRPCVKLPWARVVLILRSQTACLQGTPLWNAKEDGDEKSEWLSAKCRMVWCGMALWDW